MFMRRLVSAGLLSLLTMLLLLVPAEAGVMWCARDPIVTIDGTQVQVWVAIPEAYTPYVKDAVHVRFKTVKGLSRQLLYTDAGFNGHGERVDWGDVAPPADGSTPLVIEIQIPVDQKKLDQAFGKGTTVPVHAIVNVGATTTTFDAATTKTAKFTITLSEAVTDASAP
jgi:hypothetical protein